MGMGGELGEEEQIQLLVADFSNNICAIFVSWTFTVRYNVFSVYFDKKTEPKYS